MQTENFSLENVNDMSKKTSRKYVTKYFVPLTNGQHAMLIDGKYEVLDDNVIKKTYFARMTKELCAYYFKKFTGIKQLNFKLNSPVFYDNKLNLCPPMKFKVQVYEDFSTKIKNDVDIMIDYIKEVLCDKRDDVFDYLMKWFSNMIKGNKNTSCLYFRGPQGIGKSTLTTFMKDHVLGHDLCLETGSEPLKNHFNSELGGKLLVVFEELENFSMNEWQVVSTRLKRYITSKTISIEKKGVNAYQADNINNYIINSNNDAIKDDDGRRYFILDVQTHRAGDKKFWDNVYKCFNDEVAHAFYCYLHEIVTTDFNPQVFPLTKNKTDSLAKRLDHCEMFLKDSYILPNKSISCTVKQMFEDYVIYCDGKYKICSKIDLNKKLRDLGINHYKSDSALKFKVSHDDLMKIANKFHWLHELDEYKHKIVDDSIVDNDDEYEHGIKSEDQSVDVVGLLKKEIEELKKQLLLTQPATTINNYVTNNNNHGFLFGPKVEVNDVEDDEIIDLKPIKKKKVKKSVEPVINDIKPVIDDYETAANIFLDF